MGLLQRAEFYVFLGLSVYFKAVSNNRDKETKGSFTKHLVNLKSINLFLFMLNQHEVSCKSLQERKCNV